MRNILITGGSGMIGTRLTEHLLDKGYQVSILTRSKNSPDRVKTYLWDPVKGTIDPAAIKDADHIINLAGASIADGRWTEDRRKEIYDSRIQSTKLLVGELNKDYHKVESFVSASAVGIYGDSGDQMMKEDHVVANDFLANVCIDWEKEAQKLTNSSVRLAIARIGIVLTLEGGALPELNKTTSFGIASYLGTGEQYYSWIHIDDLCRLMIFLMENDNLTGVFNAVAPNPLTNKELVQKIVKVQGRTAAVIPAPEFALRVMLGEMADMILKTQRCSAEKILSKGFQFQFEEAETALKDLFKK